MGMVDAFLVYVRVWDSLWEKIAGYVLLIISVKIVWGVQWIISALYVRLMEHGILGPWAGAICDECAPFYFGF